MAGVSLDQYKTERGGAYYVNVSTKNYLKKNFKLFLLLFTFCNFLKEDAFIFSESFTEKYCKTELRNLRNQGGNTDVLNLRD